MDYFRFNTLFELFLAPEFFIFTLDSDAFVGGEVESIGIFEFFAAAPVWAHFICSQATW